MRTKKTAQKFTHNINGSVENSFEKKVENADIKPTSSDVDLSLECRTDNAGNQFLLDGTPVVEPTPVVEDQSNTEISFENLAYVLMKDKNVQRSMTNLSSNSSTASSISNIHVKCTGCNKRFNPYIGDNFNIHPSLQVTICSDCLKHQLSDYFVIDSNDDKETLCRWCVEGGLLICCDFCPKSFCKNCIRRNLGKEFLLSILKQDQEQKWKCFVCDNVPTAELREKCKALSESVMEQRKINPIPNKRRNTNPPPQQQQTPLTTLETTQSTSSSSPVASPIAQSSPKTTAIPQSTTTPILPRSDSISNPIQPRKRIAPAPDPSAPPNKIPLATVLPQPVPIAPLPSNTNSSIIPNYSNSQPTLSAIVTSSSQPIKKQPINEQHNNRTTNYNCMKQIHKIHQHGNSYYLNSYSVQTMLNDIDSINARNFISSIHVTKQLIESFYSDLHNLEVEISHANSPDDLDLVLNMFQACYRHHLFSRLGRLRERVVEEENKGRNGGNGNKPKHFTSTNNGNIRITSVNSIANKDIEVKEEIDLTEEIPTMDDKVSTTTKNNNLLPIVDLINDDDSGGGGGGVINIEKPTPTHSLSLRDPNFSLFNNLGLITNNK